ncbi:MAG: hypothetical protein Q8S44_06110 [Flavobacteriaceae bacterium]|nr:hypothetical protein [Flavobacteriaceae bacterium]
MLFLFFCIQLIEAQEIRTEIKGSITVDSQRIGNIHVLNLNSKQGTISDDNGFFIIPVKLGDSIMISAIQFEKKKITINKTHLKNNWIEVSLNEKIHLLDTLKLKRHHLTGLLSYDIKNTPKDTLPKISFEMPKIGDNKAPLDTDEMDKKTPPSAAHPNLASFGIFFAVPIKDGRYEAKLRFERELQRKKDFPLVIIKDFGIKFFTKDLQIDSSKINHFIAYCEFRDLMNLYYKGERLEVIRILIEESKNYHKAVHQQ